MAMHLAVVTPGVREPLATEQRPTAAPQAGEVRVRVLWTASTPLDLHQADGGLLVTPPQVLGDGYAGVIAELGENVRDTLAVGDEVFGFTWRSNTERAHQEYITVPQWIVGKVPSGIPLPAAVTVPNNFVAVWNTLGADLGLALPFPKPENYAPPNAEAPILIWGGGTSAGEYAIQVLRHFGYTRVYVTASPPHHSRLNQLGARECVDYTASDVIARLRALLGSGPVKILDCIGDVDGSIRPVAQIANSGSTVAVLLPVIVKHATDSEAPEYGMDARAVTSWADDVDVRGVRTHLYAENEWNKMHIQPEVLPALLADGAIKPNAYRIVEGTTLLERAQNALDALRRKEPRGERLVWRVCEQ